MTAFAQLIARGGPPFIFRALGMGALVSWFLTFNGVSLDDVTFWDKAVSITFSLGTAIGLYVFYWVTLKVIPNLQTPKEIIRAFIICIPFLAAILGFSSLNNVAGLEGKEALNSIILDAPIEAQESVEEALRQANMVIALKVDFENEINSYQARSLSEVQRGEYTGHAGTGAVNGALDGIAGRLIGVRESIEDFERGIIASEPETRRLLDAMNKVAHSDVPRTERIERITALSNELRTVLGRMDARLVAASIVRTLETLPNEVDIRESFARDPDVAERQRAALLRVRSDISQTVASIGGTASDIADMNASIVPAFRDVSASRAVLVKWENHLGAFAGGIGLDIMPLCIVIFYLLAMQATTERERKVARAMDMPLGDVLTALWGGDIVRRPPNFNDLHSHVQDYLTGKSDEGDSL